MRWHPIASGRNSGCKQRRKHMVAVPESIKRLEQRPWIAHMIRTVERYVSRLGSQFAAATTYFWVLALVPILMVAFSITGFVLTVVYPDLLDTVADTVTEALGSTNAATREKILDLVNTALSQYWSHWHRGPGNRSLRWRKIDGPLEECRADPVATGIRSSASEDQHCGLVARQPPPAAWTAAWTGRDIRPLLAVDFACRLPSSSFLGLDDQAWTAPLLRISSVAFSIGAGWLIFMYLYTVLPETREPWRVVRRGALLGSIALAALQYVAGFLITAFQGNPAAAIFGPVIVLMLFFNIFAQLILFIAAWIATAQHDAVPVPPGGDEYRANA